MNRPIDRPHVVGVDQALVKEIRDSANVAYERAVRPEMSPADRRQLTQALVQAELAAASRRRAEQGVPPLNVDAEAALEKAVHNAIDGVGRLQSLLDLVGVEDIYVHGSQPVLLRMADGLIREHPPIADTPEDLLAQIQYVAAFHGSRERAFSEANPILDMALPDGSRLSALCGVTNVPIVSIRKHGYTDVTLEDLVQMGMITAAMRRFLVACVQAKQTILISGVPKCGKTTFLRGLTRAIDAYTRFATLETEFELNLHTRPDAPLLLVPVEARLGSVVEKDAAGRPVGELQLSDLLPPVLRHSVELAVYGEVRGPEAYAFLEGANAGLPGSMATLHATDPRRAVSRLVHAAMKAAPQMGTEYMTSMAADGINYIVQLEHFDHSHIGGGSARFCSHIAEVTGVSHDGRTVDMNMIFEPAKNSLDPRGVRSAEGGVQNRLPFDRIGFDLTTMYDGDGWVGELDLGQVG